MNIFKSIVLVATVLVSGYSFAGPQLPLQSLGNNSKPAETISESINRFPQSKIHVIRATQKNTLSNDAKKDTGIVKQRKLRSKKHYKRV